MIIEWFNGLQPIWQVVIYALLTAVATGLGAIPFFFIKKVPKKWISLGDALAAGLMLTAGFRLIDESLEYDLWRPLLGITLGMALITWSRMKIDKNDGVKIEQLKGADAMKALMIIGVMTVHSFAEGVGIGVSFGSGKDFGTFITAAIAIHNIPEGLAITMILYPRGVSVGKCIFWSIFTSLPQPLIAAPSFLFVEFFKPILPLGLGFAAGAMIWMVASELIPDAIRDAKKQYVAVSVVTGVIIMILLQEVI